MFIWIVFLFVTYLLIGSYQHTSNTRNKRSFLILLVFALVYFATFRDGMGDDYTVYKSYCERDLEYSNSWWLIEPIPAAIQSFCYNTNFSAVIFFLITSLLIYPLVMLVYSKYDNFNIAAFVFITYTNLYLTSFNMVRQSVAAALILVGSYYFLLKKRSLFFFLFVILAFLFHKSAIVFVLLFWLRKDNFNPVVLVLLLALSFFVNLKPVFNLPIISDVLETMSYDGYVRYTAHSYNKFSLSNVFMHIMALVFILNKRAILRLEDKESCIYSLKMMVLSIVCANLSANSLPIAYRYTVFFSVFIPVLFVYLPKIIDKRIALTLIYIPFLVLLFTVLSLQSDNRLYCPERILPIESIYDRNYQPYDNPNITIY